MEFDFAEEQPKFLMLMYGLIAFVAVVGGLLLLLDVVPAWFARRREAQLVAASTGGAPLPRRRKPREGLFALFFLLPTLLLLTIGLVVPAIRTILLSFMDSGGNDWVGLRNYGWMFSEDSIVRVLLNTLIWVLLVPLVATTFGLLYAVMVDKARFESIAKSLIFLPMAISFVGASIIWKFVYAYRSEDQDQIGLLNQIVVSLGGEPRQWLLDSPLNTFLLIVIMVWIQAGFAMVVLSAAIKAIPGDIVEAARLDGVTPVADVLADHHAEHPTGADRGGGDAVDRHAQGLRHRPDGHQRQLRHQRDRQRDVQPGVPVRRERAGLRPGGLPLHPGHPDRDLPDPQPASTAGGLR